LLLRLLAWRNFVGDQLRNQTRLRARSCSANDRSGRFGDSRNHVSCGSSRSNRHCRSRCSIRHSRCMRNSGYSRIRAVR